MVLAGLTPPGWEITIVDENLARRCLRPVRHGSGFELRPFFNTSQR